jgi:hypothetical protein
MVVFVIKCTNTWLGKLRSNKLYYVVIISGLRLRFTGSGSKFYSTTLYYVSLPLRWRQFNAIRESSNLLLIVLYG